MPLNVLNSPINPPFFKFTALNTQSYQQFQLKKAEETQTDISFLYYYYRHADKTLLIVIYS